MNDPLGTPEQVADYLQKPVKTLAEWRSHGDGPRYFKVGRNVRYDWADVRAWLVGQRVDSTTDCPSGPQLGAPHRREGRNGLQRHGRPGTEPGRRQHHPRRAAARRHAVWANRTGGIGHRPGVVMAARKPKPPEPPAGLLAACPNDWIKVWFRVRAHPSVKLVGTIAAAYFANYDDGAGIYPGTVKLAAACGEMSERTVKQALAQIRGWGLMWRYVEGSKHGRRGVADTYRLTIPADVLARVPMLTPGLKRPEQVHSDHVISDHVISATGTGELSDTEQVNSQHPTSVSTSSSTTPYIERPVAAASVEGVGSGAGKASPELSRDSAATFNGRGLAPREAQEAERHRQQDALMAWEQAGAAAL